MPGRANFYDSFNRFTEVQIYDTIFSNEPLYTVLNEELDEDDRAGSVGEHPPGSSHTRV